MRVTFETSDEEQVIMYSNHLKEIFPYFPDIDIDLLSKAELARDTNIFLLKKMPFNIRCVRLNSGHISQLTAKRKIF